ncbi:MAG: hypothetical protein CML99_14265 [Rhodobiaceae bacterium]|nr:hypothetical protein [Rhodobiaceae bacterium]
MQIDKRKSPMASVLSERTSLISALDTKAAFRDCPREEGWDEQMKLTPEIAIENANVAECVARGVIEIASGKVTYHLNHKKSYAWSDPEEWVRCIAIANLVIDKKYPATQMRVEVQVPRRTPSDFADIVVYRDEACRDPYLVVECKSDVQSRAGRDQGVEQLFGNANSLRIPLGLYEEYGESRFYDVGNFEPTERQRNLLGGRDAVPEQFGEVPAYAYVAGSEMDIHPVASHLLEAKIKRVHSLIWAGGKRDPLTSFDEWSKLLFAKVVDERNRRSGEFRHFQVGTNETTAAVAGRVHTLFAQACKQDPTIFPANARIRLTDKKIYEIVLTLQEVSFLRTDVDSIGAAFENFFGAVFRGELGQYFTMRQLSRFTVAMLGIGETDYVIDPTAGSGGFLLEALLQVWHKIDREYEGQSENEINRAKMDFSRTNVFGIEIHDILGRICKINLLLHHDGHTNIEADRSCLDVVFAHPRLNPPKDKFTKLFGNPPFGDEVQAGDDDHLGANTLESFKVADNRTKVASEHVILERSVDFLEPGGELGLILPDGLFNNQGEQSNCPSVRRYLAKNGLIEAIVSLPDYAFRKSGAQNKTSILYFRKFQKWQKTAFNQVYDEALENGASEEEAVAMALDAMDYKVFLAEANWVGYTSTGIHSDLNDLYRGSAGGRLVDDQEGTILGEYRAFRADPENYAGRKSPDCMAISAGELWRAHPSHRLDPKYHLFKREEQNVVPDGWVKMPIRDVLRRRMVQVNPETRPDERVVVMTLGQTGEIRPREAGKGRNPPEWLGMYFEDIPSTWFAARAGDVVFSSIDLWKGCVAVVPPEFDGALVTKEFPIYEITDDRLDPVFLSCLLRSRYYQRAFRAITTGHSNRRRTQVGDFEDLEIAFPPDREAQLALIARLVEARNGQRQAIDLMGSAMMAFNNAIDGRGDEALPEINDGEEIALEEA